jgi:drug/metabolite transporter (DMT)-like permease
LSGGGDMGHDMDCHFSATGSGRGAGLYFWRFALASLTIMVVLIALRRLRKLVLRDHLFCILQGCCVFGFNFLCFYNAAAWINTGLESVIFSMAVLFNAVNSFLFFGQKPLRASILRLFWG